MTPIPLSEALLAVWRQPADYARRVSALTSACLAEGVFPVFDQDLGGRSYGEPKYVLAMHEARALGLI